MGRPKGSKNRSNVETVTAGPDVPQGLNLNPANRAGSEKTAETRKRIPMSVPSRKLEVPEIPGYHLYWFRDANVPRAQQAGYVFVEDREVPLNQFGVGTDKSVSGNADLGSHIRVVGGTAEGGGVEHLTLMKIKEEWWREDQKEIENRNATVIQSIFREERIAGSEKSRADDQGLAYVKDSSFAAKSGLPLFNRIRKNVR